VNGSTADLPQRVDPVIDIDAAADEKHAHRGDQRQKISPGAAEGMRRVRSAAAHLTDLEQHLVSDVG
jgi:hypothetical protein